MSTGELIGTIASIFGLFTCHSALTVHLQNRYEQAYDRIRIGDRVYQVDLRKNLRVKQVLVLTEVV